MIKIELTGSREDKKDQLVEAGCRIAEDIAVYGRVSLRRGESKLQYFADIYDENGFTIIYQEDNSSDTDNPATEFVPGSTWMLRVEVKEESSVFFYITVTDPDNHIHEENRIGDVGDAGYFLKVMDYACQPKIF